MDNPLYDHELDAYPPIPGPNARAGPINREMPGATPPGKAKAPKSGAAASPKVGPPRNPSKNPAPVPGPGGPKSAPEHGRVSFVEWFARLSVPGLIGVGLAAGVLVSASLFLAFQPLPFVMWSLYTATVFLACGLTIWSRRWVIQADLDQGGEYGLSPRELAILADKEVSPLPLIGAGVASLIDKGVVYRPPGHSSLLIKGSLPESADDLERAIYATLPWPSHFPLEVYRLAEPFLREIVQRLREQGMYVSESRYNTSRNIILGSWGAAMLIASLNAGVQSHLKKSDSLGLASVLLLIHLIILCVSVGRIPPLPQLTRRGRHALEMARKTPVPISPSNPAGFTNRSALEVMTAPKLRPPDDFSDSSRPTDPLPSKAKGATGPVAPDDFLEWDRLDAPSVTDQVDVASPSKSFFRRPISTWFHAPYEVTDLGDRVQIVLPLQGFGESSANILLLLVFYCPPVGLFCVLVWLLLLLLLKSSWDTKLTVVISAGQLDLRLGGRYDRRVTIPRKVICRIRTFTNTGSDGSHNYDIHIFEASGKVSYLSEFVRPVSKLPPEVVRLGKHMRRLLGVSGDDLKL